MHETILTLAQNISGAQDTEASLLELLCTAQEQAWNERLRSGITPEDCKDAFCCACAFSAVAGLLSGRAGEGTISFKAGDVSVQKASGVQIRAAVESFRAQAERLMAPYAQEDFFCFRGVQT